MRTTTDHLYAEHERTSRKERRCSDCEHQPHRFPALCGYGQVLVAINSTVASHCPGFTPYPREATATPPHAGPDAPERPFRLSGSRAGETALQTPSRPSNGRCQNDPVGDGATDDATRCYVCIRQRDPDDRRLVTLHTHTGDRTCAICERCLDLVEWEPFEASEVNDSEPPNGSDDDGLPPLAEGSAWVADDEEVEDDNGTRVGVGCNEPTAVWVSSDSKEFAHAGWLQDIRHVIARHDREHGRYWRDLVRALRDEVEGSGVTNYSVDILVEELGAILDEAAG